jgi:DNA-binding beta-propeller fold protein YncE
MWLLAGSSSSKTLQQLSVTTGQISDIVPASKSSVSIAQLSSGIIGVGLATDATGALELRNGSSGVLIATVPIGTPVRDVTAGFDGQTFYVLNGNATSSSVTLVNAQSAKASVSVPVPLDTIAVAVDPLGQQIYALGSGGAVRVISVATGSVTAKFGTLPGPVGLVISNSGSSLYVLKHDAAGSNVAVFNVATEQQTSALPAAQSSVGLQLSPDNQSIYNIVGTNTFGNVQVFPLSQ